MGTSCRGRARGSPPGRRRRRLPATPAPTRNPGPLAPTRSCPARSGGAPGATRDPAVPGAAHGSRRRSGTLTNRQFMVPDGTFAKA